MNNHHSDLQATDKNPASAVTEAVMPKVTDEQNLKGNVS